MTFSWPLALLSLLLIPLVLGIAWWSRRRRRRSAVTVTSIALVRAAVPGRTRWTRRIPVLLLMLGLLVLGVGAARPQATVPVPSDSTTIMLAMDVSGSMCSTDVAPNRITVAEQAAIAFVRSQAGGPKIGLVAFAGVAGLQVPPTTDTDALVAAIQQLTTARGTAIGSAILTAIDGIAAIDPAVAPTGADLTTTAQADAADVIVVLTDGANTQGVDPAQAAQQAAARGLRVYTIGFGTTTPTRMACTGAQVEGWASGGSYGGGGGGFGGPGGGFGGGRGNPLVIDEPALQQIAETTGGQYYRAENADQLQTALADLPNHVTLITEKADLAAWFAAAGGLLIALAVGLSLWWNRIRVPRREPSIR
ncbi:VWA domain-containing protein [Nakamurella lactea]|uniref:VWA domain-containing protein n=1 Tax=Nakamurella lactea TaxID=459515 RepID=UPI000406FFC8|nr:VWA domain-containing protein [Nakamurella lactea]